MPANLHRFINRKFLKTIDLGLMRELLERHRSALGGFDPADLAGEEGPARDRLRALFEAAVADLPEGLVADLHRIEELGGAEGLELLLQQARRAGVTLVAAEEEGAAPARHDPKHVALRAYLHHPEVFDAASDMRALKAPAALAEFAGPERHVGVDLTERRREAFLDRFREILRAELRGEYCRLGAYQDGDDIDLVVSHGAPVSTLPVVEDDDERVISLRAVRYAVLRWSEGAGLLRLGGVPRARQAEIAELFAATVLGRPGFFSGPDARELYTLEPIERAGFDFAFAHAFDPGIDEVRIVAASADLVSDDGSGRLMPERTLRSIDASGAALAGLRETPVRFGRGWRLGEITVRVRFRDPGARPAQVTLRLKPPGTAAFRRTRFEARIMTLLERNGLVLDRDDTRVLDAAE